MSEWISVKEMLPEKAGVYLTAYNLFEPVFCKDRRFVKYGIIATKAYVEFNKNYYVWDDREYHYVTHWMELPELPKED